jgi:hypothetical protein
VHNKIEHKNIVAYGGFKKSISGYTRNRMQNPTIKLANSCCSVCSEIILGKMQVYSTMADYNTQLFTALLAILNICFRLKNHSYTPDLAFAVRSSGLFNNTVIRLDKGITTLVSLEVPRSNEQLCTAL